MPFSLSKGTESVLTWSNSNNLQHNISNPVSWWWPTAVWLSNVRKNKQQTVAVVHMLGQ